MKKKLLIPIMVLTLLIATVGGTMAWLMDQTQEVKNTFTVGNVDITLVETDSDDEDTDADNNSYKMIPGNTIDKDPVVTVEANSEDCYLFVTIKEAGGNVTVGETAKSFSDFITYDVIDEWTLLETAADGTKVYYRTVDASNIDQSFNIIQDANGTDNKVTVKDTVTKEMMDAITADSTKAPTLTFKAYAIQSANIASAADAWVALNQ